jgi:hypothetical protein
MDFSVVNVAIMSDDEGAVCSDVTYTQQLIEGGANSTLCAAYLPVQDVPGFYPAPVPLESPA